MAEPETLRLLLQNKFDRIENLVQMNHAATLAVPSVLATIWSIEGGFDNFRNAGILSLISIGLVLIWRAFAHYLDCDITDHYHQIIDLEHELEIPSELSLYQNLFLNLSVKPNITNFCDVCKKNLVTKLIENRKIGWRGHDNLDILALCFIFICSSMMIFGLQFIYTWMIFFILFSLLVLIMWVIGNIWLMTGFLILFSLFSLPLLIPILISIGIGVVFYFGFNDIIQKDPNLQDIQKILKKIGCPFDPYP
jgi:hypothetical protein